MIVIEKSSFLALHARFVLFTVTILLVVFVAKAPVHAAPASPQGQVNPGNPPTFPLIPPRPSIGAETHRVYPDRIEVVGGQTHYPTGGDLQFILATCLRLYAKPPAYPNPVIGIYGDLAANVGSVTQQMHFGGGDVGSKPYRADWGASTPMNFTVIGMDPVNAKIPGFVITDELSGTPPLPWGGIGTVRFEFLRIESQGAACVQTSQKLTSGGTILLYDIGYLRDPDLAPGDFGGYKIKWGIRGHGPARWDIRNGIFVGSEEHSIYVDSPQGDSYIHDITHIESGSTAVQVVNRPFNCPEPPDHQPCVDQYLAGTLPVRPTGFGKLLIYEVAVGSLKMGQGGSGITVVGHKDDVWIKDITHTNSTELQHGSAVVWVEDNPAQGAHLWSHSPTSTVYATKRVVLKNMTVNVAAQNRDAIQLSAVGKLEVVHPWSVTSDRTAFALDTNHGIGSFAAGQAVVLDGILQQLPASLTVQNRDPYFYWPDASANLSAYAGFHGPGAKISEDGVVLTDGQIDLRWPDPGVHN